MTDVIPAPFPPRIPVRGGGSFPVRRVYCVGRNFAEHAREMGAAAPSASDRGQPMFFLKPADALVLDGVVPYPPGTTDLHHEVELVVALGHDASPGVLTTDAAPSLVYGYAIGLDLTRRDLQAAAKAKGHPWDIAKSFDHCAPVSEIVPANTVGTLDGRTLTLQVNGSTRQRGAFADLIWNVPEILHELSKLYALRAGDLVFMGTPTGVGPLQVGDRFVAGLDDLITLSGVVAPSRSPG